MCEVNSFFEKQLDKYGVERAKHIWFTSDTHFSHANIIKFCARPFETVEEMDEVLIKNWNDRVQPDDIVFHLGDFAWGGSGVWNGILDRLNGHIHLILGNHDMKNLRQGYLSKFASVAFQKQIYIEGRCIYLNHYPFLCYGGAYRGDEAVWEVFGHVHTRNNYDDISSLTDEEVKEILGKDAFRIQHVMPTQYDVGVDQNNYAPVSWAEVKEIINKQVEYSKRYKDLSDADLTNAVIRWRAELDEILNNNSLTPFETKKKLDTLDLMYRGYFDEIQYRQYKSKKHERK